MLCPLSRSAISTIPAAEARGNGLGRAEGGKLGLLERGRRETPVVSVVPQHSKSHAGVSCSIGLCGQFPENACEVLPLLCQPQPSRSVSSGHSGLQHLGGDDQTTGKFRSGIRRHRSWTAERSSPHRQRQCRGLSRQSRHHRRLTHIDTSGINVCMRQECRQRSDVRHGCLLQAGLEGGARPQCLDLPSALVRRAPGSTSSHCSCTFGSTEVRQVREEQDQSKPRALHFSDFVSGFNNAKPPLDCMLLIGGQAVSMSQ